MRQSSSLLQRETRGFTSQTRCSISSYTEHPQGFTAEFLVVIQQQRVPVEKASRRRRHRHV